MLRARGFALGEARIAYEVLGAGPETLVVTPGWMSHLDYDWATPEIRAWYEALARGRRVVRYDKRGTGLSERSVTSEAFSLDAEMRDCLAVMDAAGIRRASFLATSGPMAISLAVAHPRRVDKLVLYGCYARLQVSPDHPIGKPPDRLAALVGLVRSDWGLGSRVLAGVFVPEADPARVAWFTTYQRIAATADVAIAFLRSAYADDVRELLPKLSCPVLVIHRREDQLIPFAHGEYLAAHIPHASLCPLEGEHHIPYFGDTASLVGAVERFLALPGRPARPLSPREREVLGLVADGLRNRDIAARLRVSEATVTRHLANIMAKLGVASRAAAVAHAIRLGLM